MNGGPCGLRLSRLGAWRLQRWLWLLLRWLPDRDLLRRRPEVRWRNPERERRLEQLRWYQAVDHLRAQRKRRPGRLGAQGLRPGRLLLLWPGALLLLICRRG